jgi:hypothetical protein
MRVIHFAAAVFVLIVFVTLASLPRKDRHR